MLIPTVHFGATGFGHWRLDAVYRPTMASLQPDWLAGQLGVGHIYQLPACPAILSVYGCYHRSIFAAQFVDSHPKLVYAVGRHSGFVNLAGTGPILADSNPRISSWTWHGVGHAGEAGFCG